MWAGYSGCHACVVQLAATFCQFLAGLTRALGGSVARGAEKARVKEDSDPVSQSSSEWGIEGDW